MFLASRALRLIRPEAAGVSLIKTSIVDGPYCEDGLDMSALLPISFFLTLLCVLGAIDGLAFQQLLFVGAAVAAILVSSLEAWNSREPPCAARMRAAKGQIARRGRLAAKAV